MKRVAVTGSSGFIGKEITKRLRANGYSILGISRKKGIDVLGEELEAKLTAFKPDAVIHLAGAKAPPFDVNIFGTLSVLLAAKASGAKQFIYASTDSVYGNPIRSPVKESDPTHPINDYGRSKLVGEYLCLSVFQNSLILRIFNPYGRNPRFSRRLSSTLHIMVGERGQVRDFVYIDDVVDAIIEGLAGRWSGVYNVGTGKGTSLEELANLRAGKKVSTIFVRRFPDAKVLIADISRIKARGWKPKVTLKEGIELARASRL